MNFSPPASRRRYHQHVSFLDDEDLHKPDAPPSRPTLFDRHERFFWWLSSSLIVAGITLVGARLELAMGYPQAAGIAILEGLIIGLLTIRYHDRRLFP